MEPNNSDKRKARTTEKSLRIIDALKELDGARIAELANYLGLANSTVHSHLVTLTEHDYVAKEGDIYHIGLRFLNVGEYARNRKRIFRMAKSTVEEIADETGELSQFLVEEHGLGIFIHRSEGIHGVQTNTPIGKRVPLHQTAAGKSILAYLPRERVEQIIDRKGLPQVTEKTITDREELFTTLNRIRDRGVAFQKEELMNGVNAIGVPVKGPNGQVLGALGVAGPANRMDGDRFNKELPNFLLGTANELEINFEHSQG